MTKLKFSTLDISEELQNAIADMGFEEATGIQSVAIPKAMEGVDMIGQAQTGTGKTVAFGIPAIEKVDTKNNKPQVIILCPTRELAIQVSEEMQRLGKYKHNLRILPVYGGQPIDRQIRSLARGAQIIIGTPGRVMDHMRRGTLKLGHINTMILDEADEMLNMGFREDIETILLQIPAERQILLFSATMPKPILDISNKYLNNPTIIRVKQKDITISNVKQLYLKVNRNDRTEVLCRLMDINNPKRTIIFCNTKKGVDQLVGELQGRGYFADALHGDLNQNARDMVMGKLRSGTIDILVATDIAARGIDVDDIEAVFNYELPQDSEYYIHRIGRTGRAGRTGTAFSFVYGRQMQQLREIERYTKAKIEEQKVPTMKDITKAKTEQMFTGIIEVIEKGDLDQYDQYIGTLVEKGHELSVIAAALLKMQMNIKEQTEITSVTRPEFSRGDRGDRRDRSSRGPRNPGKAGMIRFFMNIGKQEGVNAGDIVGAVAGEVGIAGRLIRDVSVHDKFSFFEVPQEHSKGVTSIMNKKRIKGKRINVEVANAK